MSPIQGFSDLNRLERLGRIRLGYRIQNPKHPDDPTKTIPKAADHLVCPPEVKAVYGDKPTQIYPIMFPSEDQDQWLSQFYRCYGQTYGLTCMGDGIEAKRKIDTETGAMADRNTPDGRAIWKEGLTCEGEDCPEYIRRQCRPMMRLQFMLPEVPGLGVYEICTTSFHSRLNIQSMIRMVKEMSRVLTPDHLPRIAMIPFTLAVGSQEVNPPGQKKKTVWILHLKHNAKLGDFLRVAMSPGTQFQLVAPAAQTPEEAEREEPPDDLTGGEEEDTAHAQSISTTQEVQAISAPTSTTPESARAATQTGASAKPAAAKKGETQPAKNGTQPKTSGDPSVQECELELGTGSWDTLFSAKVYSAFAITALCQLTADQRKTIHQWIQAEKSKKTLRENAATAAAATVIEGADGEPAEAEAVAPPRDKKWADLSAAEKDLRRAQMEFARTLSEQAGMTQEAAIAWMEKELGKTTTEGMTLGELEDSIAKAKAAAANSVVF